MCNVVCDAAMIWGGGGSVTQSHRDQIVFILFYFKAVDYEYVLRLYGWGCGVLWYSVRYPTLSSTASSSFHQPNHEKK